MEFREVVRRRRMVRRYADDAVDPAVVDRMLAHAQRAPSAGFSQGWAFLVLDTPADVDRFWTSTTPEHAAARPPSAGFSQGWAFLVLDTADDVALFWEATTPADPVAEGRAERVSRPPSAWLEGMRTAPVVIVPLACREAYLDRYAEPDKGWSDRQQSRWPVPYWYVDTGMASLLILQTAVDEGLGACFFGIPAQRTDAFREAFGVPPDHDPIGAITVGHRTTDTGPAGSPARRERRQDVVHRGRW